MLVKGLLLVLSLAPVAAGAQVQVSLVAADRSVQAGQPVTAALRLDHAPSWHTYWVNAGTGYPTSLEWSLPPDWSAGNIDWPTPIRIIDSTGTVTGNGFDGVLYLPVTLTPPAQLTDQTAVTLTAKAKWLMCADICIPGQQTVSLTLPVSSATPQPNEQVRAALDKQSMPRDVEWAISASRSQGSVFLSLGGAGAVQLPHFFSEDGFIQYDEPQPVARGDTGPVLKLPVAADAPPDTGQLIGILAYTDAQGAYRGARVAAPLTATAPAGLDSLSFGVDSTQGADVSGSPSSGSWLRILMLAFVGGLILNLMPCVFPVLGIKVVGFVSQAQSDRRKVVLYGLTFTFGVLLSFWVLAGALAVLRAGGEQLGWGFQLQSPAFVFALAAVMLVFALNLSGVFELGARATGIGGNLQMRQGYAGSFFTGVLATIVATPCTAPFLTPALGAAFTLSTAQSFVVFSAIALGLSSPYLLLTAFPQAVRWLPRPGRWMETFKQAMAFPLYATMGFLIWVLAGQTGESGLLMAMLGLTLIAMAAWLYGRYCTPGAPGASRAQARFGLIGALVLMAAGAVLGVRGLAPALLVWEPWSNDRIAQLREEGRPIYVDFTARWCATCQANKRVVFGSSEVLRYFREHDVAPLKADWTNADPVITAELERWNRAAIPFNLIYRRGGGKPIILPEILTPSIVLQAFESN